MRFFKYLYSKLCWRRDNKHSLPTLDYSLLDRINNELKNTVEDTSKISQRIIAKLESQVDILENEITEREELLSQVFGTIPDFLCLKDGEGRWKLINAYGKKLYGIDGQSYKNKTDAEIAEMYPRYSNNLAGCIKTDEEAWNSKAPYQIEERSIDYFGREVIFDVVKTPIFNEDGSRKHLLVHGKNVTEELTNSKHIRMLLSALNKASDSITVTDHNHNIIYVNEAFCKIYGYTHQEVIEKRRNLVSSGLTPDATYQSMYKSLAKAEVWTGVMINKTKSGEILRELVTITPILNGKPYPIYYIGINRVEERRKVLREGAVSD
jgi:PAS domain S-box-containing protein